MGEKNKKNGAGKKEAILAAAFQSQLANFALANIHCLAIRIQNANVVKLMSACGSE